MSHRLGISGSVILTNPDKFIDLFMQGIEHIEIGEFPNKITFLQFIELVKEKEVSFGLHSPLYRDQSKYDLIERVQFDPEQAWEQFEWEVEHMSSLGAEYVLVHFPYFKQETPDANNLIEEGLVRFSRLQQKYDIDIVCEPKLGYNRSAAGINHLHDFPLEVWDRYGIKLCIDIGDYLLGIGERTTEYIEKWKSHIKVVHLHNVEIHDEKYIWVPIHPSHENDGAHFNIKELIHSLSHCENVYFVFEHTPHTNPTKEFVEEGIHWVKELVKERILEK